MTPARWHSSEDDRESPITIYPKRNQNNNVSRLSEMRLSEPSWYRMVFREQRIQKQSENCNKMLGNVDVNGQPDL
jgi:hypothetical protein